MIETRAMKTSFRKATCLTVIALAALSFAGLSQAVDSEQGKAHAMEGSSEIQLSHDLKVILNQEMNGIEDGMMKIVSALAAGNWETIANIAEKLKNSFILKQKLTPKQRGELHSSLPLNFIEMDRSFHSTAGKMVHAAKQHDGELVNYYFSKLQDKCIQCHTKYASKRFPGLKSPQPGEGEKH